MVDIFYTIFDGVHQFNKRQCKKSIIYTLQISIDCIKFTAVGLLC